MEVLIPSALAILLSALSPLLVSVLTRSSMSSKTKSWVAVGVSAVIAIGWLWISGGLAALLVAGSAIAFVEALGLVLASVYGLQQAVHVFLFKGTAMAENLLRSVGITDGETDANGSGFDAEMELETELEEELGD